MPAPDRVFPLLLSHRVFYGWYVVAAVFVVTTALSGFFFYNLSILLAAFVAERGFPVGLASSATATFFLSAGIGGMLAGRLVDRIDVRLLVTCGALLGTLALASIAMLRELWHLYAFHVALGFAHGTAGLVPVTTVLARWFSVKRSVAFSIGSTGLSVGGVVVSPLVALGVARYGLDATAPWMACGLFLGVVPITLLVLRPSPQSMGLTPDGLSRAEAAASAPQPSTSARDALRSTYFRAVSLSYLFLFGAQVGGIAHLYRLAATRSGPETAALALSVLAGTSVVGRLAGGAALQRMSSLTFALWLMAGQAVALGFLALADVGAAIVAGAFIFGLTTGNSLMMHPLLLVERFGSRDYGRIYSGSQMITTLGFAAGPAAVGLIYDASSGYALPFAVIAVASLVGLAILGVWGRPGRPA